MERGQKSGCDPSCYHSRSNLCINNACRRSCNPNIKGACANAGPGDNICADVFDMDDLPLGPHCVERTLACCGSGQTDNFKLQGSGGDCDIKCQKKH